MEIEVKEALRALTSGETQMSPHQVLSLQDRLRIVDEKFSLLRKEVSRLNAFLAEEKDKNDLLKAKVALLEKQSTEIKAKQSVKSAPKKSPKKKTTKKK